MRLIIDKPAAAIIVSIILAVLFIMPLVCIQQASAGENLPNIIVVTLSGVRNMDSIDDPNHQYIPNFWNKMLKEGTLYTNLINLNHEFHMPVVHAINTGINYTAYYSALQRPSLFQYFKKKYNLPRTKAWSIGHWYTSDCANETEDYPKDTFPCVLSFISFSFPEELSGALTKQEQKFCSFFTDLINKNPGWPSWDSIGVIQHKFFKKIILKFYPKLVHYVMNDIECAHSDTFSRYVLALRTCDRNIFDIWRMIQTEPFYKNNTYLIVNVDHERNIYYMDHNENSYDNPSRVWLYIYGPGVKKGQIINRRIKHTDIFATVADLLALDTLPAEGEFLRDCFINSR